MSNLKETLSEAIGKKNKYDLTAKHDNGKLVVHEVNHKDLRDKHGYAAGQHISSNDLDELTDAGFKVKEV